MSTYKSKNFQGLPFIIPLKEELFASNWPLNNFHKYCISSIISSFVLYKHSIIQLVFWKIYYTLNTK